MPEDPAFFLPQARLANELRAGGLDVFTPMSVAWYNDYLQVRHAEHIVRQDPSLA